VISVNIVKRELFFVKKFSIWVKIYFKYILVKHENYHFDEPLEVGNLMEYFNTKKQEKSDDETEFKRLEVFFNLNSKI
jgi:hypothetical protein